MAVDRPLPPIESPNENAGTACDCGCDCGGRGGDDNIGCNPGVPPKSSSSQDGIRYFNGHIRFDATDLNSSGFGTHWDHTRIFCNRFASPSNLGQGTNWMVFRWSYLVNNPTTHLLTVVRGTQGTLQFQGTPRSGGGVDYISLGGAFSTVVYDSASDVYTLTLPCGIQAKYNGFTQTTYPAGLISEEKSPSGLTTSVQSYTADGQIAEFRRTAPAGGTDTLTESFASTYDTGLRVTAALLQRRVNAGSWTAVRQSVYEYYGTGSSSCNGRGLHGRQHSETGPSNGVQINEYEYDEGWTVPPGRNFTGQLPEPRILCLHLPAL